MPICVHILAQVQAEVSSLPETITSMRQLGPVTVYDSSTDPAIAAIAESTGVRYVPIEWHQDFAESFNTMLASNEESFRLLVHADEVIEDIGVLPAVASQLQPVICLVRHRITDQQAYAEAREPRLLPPGNMYRFVGRYAPELFLGDEAIEHDTLPESSLVLAHFPARWPGLAEQRISIVMSAMEAALAEEPENENHLYALLYRYWTLNRWPQVQEFAQRWRAVADLHSPRQPLVDYYEACAATVLRDIRRAESLTRSALAREERFADAWYLLGELRKVRRDIPGARQAFRRASEFGLQAEPVAVEDYSLSTWRPLLALAQLAEVEGQTAEAEQWRVQAEIARTQLFQG